MRKFRFYLFAPINGANTHTQISISILEMDLYGVFIFDNKLEVVFFEFMREDNSAVIYTNNCWNI